MLRYVASIFAGYFLILLWVMTSHSIVWWIGGPGFAFREGTMIETLPWIVLSLAFWLIGGVIGGFVSALVARHPANLPSWVLAVLVLGMSLYSAFAYMQTGPQDLPAGVDPASIDAAQFGVKPTWYPFTMAVLVAAGVLAGSWLHGDQSEELVADEQAE
ncbi:MAG: hypothetical protein KY432_04350 [Acidobacteria bacterium]|nr:hypothetical protein [Acidobacteriota bacterium]